MMSDEQWNKKQEEVFASIFTPVENGISAKKVIKSLEGRRTVWQKLYSMVGKDLESYNDRFSLMDVGRIIYNGKQYLVLRCCLWDFVVIDLETLTCIDEELGLLMVQDDAFVKFRGIASEDLEYFTFDKLKKKTAKKVVDYYIEYQEVFDGPRRIFYKFYDKHGIKGSFSVNVDKSDVMVSVNDIVGGRCNYIFLDNNLKVYGASNLTGNKEEVARMFDGSRDILLPQRVILPVSKDLEDMEKNNGNSFSINKQV